MSGEDTKILGRTWTHGAVKDLTMSLSITLNKSLKKNEYIDLLLDAYSLPVIEHLLVTNLHCLPLRSVSPIDNRRILDHKIQNTISDYYLSCFLTSQDASECLDTIIAQKQSKHAISDILPMSCFVYPDEIPSLEEFTSSKESFSNMMTKELIVPLGVVINHDIPDRLIGIVTTIGIFRISASFDNTLSCDIPILKASPKLCQELHSPGPCIEPENVFSILSMIRPCGQILCDQGSSTIATVLYKTSTSFLLDIIKFKIFNEKKMMNLVEQREKEEERQDDE
jgi:hypothetical protein